ncbi:hypothetical protein D9757_007853 [Collybiopsis confluens]|uniref:Ras GEF n=1 Tax=Collybiopsis confluens TaxID=2823264 RepID=A0A8H5HDN0_9AGAR|nr:hypothetical protein D9757_007853 [Collybiopsis confluens]
MATVTAAAAYNVAGTNGNSHRMFDIGGGQMLASSSTSSSSSSLSSMYQAHAENGARSSDYDSPSLADDNDTASLYPALFCRAKYDYVAQDTSALSFQTGDIIEVLTQQPSGWWDGLLNDERGWFPSNYVTLISEEEAEREFEERYGSQNQSQLGADGQGQVPAASTSTAVASPFANRQSVVDMSQALMASSSSSGAEDAELWLSNAIENNHLNTANAPSSASDFWMPQVAPNGQIFYVNTKTGEQSRDLPTDPDEEISSDNDLNIAHSRGFGGDQLNHLNQLGNLSSSHLSLGPGSAAADPSAGGFGVPRRTGTPEPWVRRLADDGMSYYYFNKLDGSQQWTRPEGTQPTTPTTAVPPAGRTASSNPRPTSVYSDTSDIHPMEMTDSPRRRGHAHSISATTATAVSISHQNHALQLTSAEIIANSLQQALLPPSPESPLELAATARGAIQTIVQRLRQDPHLSEGEYDERDHHALLAMEGIDELISQVVESVRNLLYVSAVPTISIPSTVLPKGYIPPFPSKPSSSHQSSSSRTHDRSHSHSSHPNAPLKPAQRKVTATLSRLVLSARAITYDAGTVSPSDTAGRISSDAEELDKAVAAFTGEVQKLSRAQQTQPREFQQLGRKRLKGALDARNLGLGLPGAGASSGWSGFGWVSFEPDAEVKAATKPLSPDVISEVAASITRLDVLLGMLALAVSSPDGVGRSSQLLQDHESSAAAAQQIHSFGRDVVAQVQTVLDLIADVDVADSVVIDTPPPPQSSNSSLGHNSVETVAASSSISSITASSTTLSSVGLSSLSSVSNTTDESTIVSSSMNGHSTMTINEAYTRALLAARTLLRSFEAAVQSLFDDATSLFDHVQLLRMDPLSSISSIAHSPDHFTSLHHDRDICMDMINILCTSLKANSAVVVQKMERLLTIGAEQKDTVGIKEWEGGVRFSREVSRRSLVRSSMFVGFGFSGDRPSSVLRAPAGFGHEYDLPAELQPEFGMSSSIDGAPDDELGLEDAFARPQRPLRIEPNRYQGPQSPDVYGVPAPQIQRNTQSFSASPAPLRSAAGVKPSTPNKANNAPQFNQRNGTGVGVGKTYREMGRQGYGSESEPGSYGMASSASEGEDGFELEGEEEEEDRFDIDVNGGDALTPKPNTPVKPAGGKPKISSKVAKILGEEAPPWFLLPNQGEGGQEKDIVIDSDKSVKGGTVQALVERLTAHDQTDPNFTKAFLMTFKSFTTLDGLFDLLVHRFRIQPPSGLSVLELRQWTSKKKNIVQFRVINTFKSMLTDEDILEKEDLYILDRMQQFVTSEDVALVGASRPLLTLVERVQKSGETKRLVVKAAQTAPIPILPKGISLTSATFPSIGGNKKLKLTDIDPLELARQLTLFESSLYQKIRPMECLQRAREGSKGDKGEAGAMDNIAFVIQTSNRIADWVAESVLTKEDSKKRAAAVKHLILVADRCRTLNNFSSMIAIVSGLNTPPIRRLKRTWEQVSQRHMAQFGACEVTLDSNKNFLKYRSMLASVVPPCVPFIGVFLSTLQFIQDGNKDLLSDGMVNFKKRQMASEVISDIKRWQAHSYNLQIVPPFGLH